MKAVPLWQPWASLVAVGAKRVETRHWPAPGYLVGRRIAIHATKTRDWLHMCDEEPFNEYLGGQAPRLPLGAVIATVVLDRCREITYEKALELEERNWHEFAFGNYEPGRFAWVLRDVEAIDPIPFRGSQGIFEVPDHLLGPAAATPPAPAQTALEATG